MLRLLFLFSAFTAVHSMAPKWDTKKFFKCSLKKPLGLSLEEVVENESRGVMITEVKDGGSAKAANLGSLKGQFLVSVNDVDCRFKTFDEVLDVIGGAPEPIELAVVAPDDVLKGAAVLKVVVDGGKVVSVNTLKGMMLRDALLSSGIDVYTNTAKLTNCSGNQQCATCVVDVTNDEGWEPRSDLEAKRLKKYSTTCRLSCATPIEGDCDVTIRPAKLS